ncbi:MAG: dual specificity protein phosphatase family protein [Proteobacteria bacterium]|nr:dual specificity protein phosphatase family protein [Pseudomonadota bacterium]
MPQASGIYWVEAPLGGRLAIVARPRSARSFAQLKAVGVDVLVSLLEPEEAVDVGLGDEAERCHAAGIAFIGVPVMDHGVPDAFEPVEAAVDEVKRHLAAGRGVAAHCFAGLGRSPLFVAATLIAHGYSDMAAIAMVSKARGYNVPEMDGQHDWLGEFARRQRQD